MLTEEEELEELEEVVDDVVGKESPGMERESEGIGISGVTEDDEEVV